MAKQVAHDTKLDRQVERYLAEPVKLTDIAGYDIVRTVDGMTVLTVKVFVDNERFEEEPDSVKE